MEGVVFSVAVAARVCSFTYGHTSGYMSVRLGVRTCSGNHSALQTWN